MTTEAVSKLSKWIYFTALMNVIRLCDDNLLLLLELAWRQIPNQSLSLMYYQDVDFQSLKCSDALAHLTTSNMMSYCTACSCFVKQSM